MRLSVAPRTAEAHVENIRRKLQVRSRAQIAAWVTEHRLRSASVVHPRLSAARAARYRRRPGTTVDHPIARPEPGDLSVGACQTPRSPRPPVRSGSPRSPHPAAPLPGARPRASPATRPPVYVFFLRCSVYAVGFFVGLGVPKGIDQGPHSAWPLAVAIDAALLLLFAVQHTVMARPWFKRRWTRLVPRRPSGRRSCWPRAWCWRWCSGCGGRSAAPSGTCPGRARPCCSPCTRRLGGRPRLHVPDQPSDLFGLRQACLHARGSAYRPPGFTERGCTGGSGIR